MNTIKKRNSSIELLRIFAMFLILLSHCVSHSEINIGQITTNYNKILIQVLTLGNLGVNLFILITGFFNYNKKFEIKKIIKLYIDTLFYSIIIYAILIITDINDFSVTMFIKSIFPITFNEYWFVTAYIMLIIISSLLNIIINNIEKEKHLKYIFVGCFIWGILKTITAQDYYGNQLIHFSLMYLIGSYLGKYKPCLKNKKALYMCISFISIILIISTICINLIAAKIPAIEKYGTYFFKRDSILIIISSFCIFLLFINNSFENKMINKISSSAFSVYLIHDNPNIREFLWVKLLKVNEYINSPLLIFYVIIIVIFVFFTCILIDKIKKKLLDNIIEKLTMKITNIIDRGLKIIGNYYNKIRYNLFF